MVEVKPRLRLNYLLPQGLATIATDHHKRMVEKHRAQLRQIEKARLAGLQELADEPGQPEHHDRGQRQRRRPPLRLGRRDGDRQRPEAGQRDAPADQVRLKGPLKELGLYTVKIHLGHEIEAELKVWVVPTVGEERPAPPAPPQPS